MNLYDQIAANKQKSIAIIAIFIALITGLGYIFSIALDYGYSLFVAATAFAIISTAASYYFSDKIALSMSGARLIGKQAEPRLFRMVENLSLGLGITPPPQVFIIEDPAINAFATGRNPKHSSVAVTRGALNKLEDLELEGVLAHEISHIQNYDILTMSVTVVLVGIIALASEWFIRIQWWGGRKSDRDNSNSNGIFMIIAIVGAILAPLMAQLLKMAMSRQREYLADASAGLLTRYPEGLARALEKINADQTPMAHASSATAHLFISNPLGSVNQRIANLFSTHPPIEERIRRLRSM